MSALLLAFASLGCASATRQLIYAPDELRNIVASRVPDLRADQVAIPYQVPDSAVEVAVRWAGRRGDPRERAFALVDALSDRRAFGLKYQFGETYTAAETLRVGAGDCMSLSSVLVGLARRVGLSAYYVDASTRRVERHQADNVNVAAGHIAVLVPTYSGDVIVDFSGRLPHYRRYRRIDDVEALAHYYNNRGYMEIREVITDDPKRWRKAQRNFAVATRVQPDFARAWNNVGVAAARLGDPMGAERSYRRAIAADPRIASPYLNLSSLHLKQDRVEDALLQLEMASELDPRNPVVHYAKGLALYRLGTLDLAARALRRSIDLADEYAAPRELLREVEQGLAGAETNAEL